MTRMFHAWSFAACLLLGLVSHAQAQIKNPGDHHRYFAEVEPHLVLQWAQEPAWNDDGIGVGVRASFVLIDNGPVETINNSFALGVGLDWAHFGDNCNGWFGPDDDCSADDFWLPIAVQWNFYFSDLISAFPELGLGIQHTTWEADWCGPGPGNNGRYCDGNDTDLEAVFWLGVRFHLADSFALTLRLGTPSLLLGASFFL